MIPTKPCSTPNRSRMRSQSRKRAPGVLIFLEFAIIGPACPRHTPAGHIHCHKIHQIRENKILNSDGSRRTQVEFFSDFVSCIIGRQNNQLRFLERNRPAVSRNTVKIQIIILVMHLMSGEVDLGGCRVVLGGFGVRD